MQHGVAATAAGSDRSIRAVRRSPIAPLRQVRTASWVRHRYTASAAATRPAAITPAGQLHSQPTARATARASAARTRSRRRRPSAMSSR
ncbi:hypothetical protein [Planomonospora sphaerica]|uniref:hypothetical protein n=1 Tax=Planomonospora sphaerica TaxID=161355 RepID=UPI000839F8E1|nr:hypothetical protein [Planomonospora sphaerica]